MQFEVWLGFCLGFKNQAVVLFVSKYVYMLT